MTKIEKYNEEKDIANGQTKLSLLGSGVSALMIVSVLILASKGIIPYSEVNVKIITAVTTLKLAFSTTFLITMVTSLLKKVRLSYLIDEIQILIHDLENSNIKEQNKKNGMAK